ncbi:ATP-dependent RNA helicase DDX54 [Chironomus tepperi]|uniref:ATP-dependent RNA helicase DDX54 n=1 Tax=Chironomus tepperi TaxID=113505 RepID=UPI00391F94C7
MTELDDDLIGFSSIPDHDDGKEEKKDKKNKKSGFLSMGLSDKTIKAIQKRGYKIPTAIQRKTIPVIMDNRDIVAMAKTGSGKTACFLIPLFEKLKQRSTKSNGARALILTPTRELAIQTYKFMKDLGKFHDLKTVLVLGGDSMDSQFSAIHDNPDVIVATPGRFLHICMEMDLKLGAVEYVVFDESDRLFEMGFSQQINEIIRRLPDSRQTVMFSATLPALLVDFAKAGLTDPVLIRLDVDTKIPEALELRFIFSRSDERYASLLVLMKHFIPQNAQTIIFAATQHHVELISLILTKANISNTYVYSNLDPSARKINTAKFAHNKVNVLVVTDIAARGIDIPCLDYVINFHYPGKPKLFIHRIGRCARAGRSGKAYSIFSTEDEAHLLDTHLFLNRPLDIQNNKCIGVCDPALIEEEQQFVLTHIQDSDIANIYRVSNNAYKAYIQTRPTASVDSNKKVKHVKFNTLQVLEEFQGKDGIVTDTSANEFKANLLEQMKKYKARTTIFELNPKLNDKQFLVMRDKRKVHENKIQKYREKEEETKNDYLVIQRDEDDESFDDDDEDGKPRNKKRKKGKSKSKNAINALELSENRDKEYFIPYQPKDKITEDGFAINSFTRDAQQAEFSVTADSAEGQRLSRTLRKWDRKKKKMVNVVDPRAGKIRTEHGVWIPASYKTDRYAKWKERTKIEDRLDNDAGSDEETLKPQIKSHPHTSWGRHNAKVDLKKRLDPELKTRDQLIKQRTRKQKLQAREMSSKMKNDAKRKRAAAKNAAKAKGKKK